VDQLSGIRKLISFINAERERQNLTQNELGERCGMQSGTISRILGGQVTPSVDSIEKLAKGLGYNLSAFLVLATTGPKEFREVSLLHVHGQLSEINQDLLFRIAEAILDAQRRRNS